MTRVPCAADEKTEIPPDVDARLDRLRNRMEESRAIAEIAARHLRRLLRR
jgi:hypothetical protein